MTQTRVATLVAAPGQLRAEAVDGLRQAWRGVAPRWLSPGEAAEFEVDGEARDPSQAWASLQTQRIDLLVQPAAGRRKRLLLADMDSTMIRQECIDELAAEAGVGDRVAAITARAMNGEVGFEGALRERVALLKGLREAVIDRVLRERITFMPGGRALVATMRAHGARAVLVSGGFLSFADKVARTLGFDEARANGLVVEDGRLTGQVAEPILGREAKVAALREACAGLGIGPEDVLAVGDGANDLGMLRLAGAGVALHAKPAVQAECSLRVNHGDLTALLFMQGYARAEFAA